MAPRKKRVKEGPADTAPPAAAADESKGRPKRVKKEAKSEEQRQPVTSNTQKRGRKAALVKEESNAAGKALKKLTEQLGAADNDSASDSTKPELEKHASSGEESEDVDWDDVDITARQAASAKFDAVEEQKPDLDLTLEKAERLQLAKTGKKKQSARAMHQRCFCHYMSVIALVSHAAWRNKWISEPQLQKAMREMFAKRAKPLHEELMKMARSRGNYSSNDFLELMGRVKTRFEKIFKRTRSGLRKLGYRHVSRLFEDGIDFVNDAEVFSDFEAYLDAAKLMCGSRDFGAQLFTALLRAYHFKVRLISSIQSLGYKFNEKEEYTNNEPASKPIVKRESSGKRDDPVDLSQTENKPKGKRKRKQAQVIDVDSSDLSEPGSDVEALLHDDEIETVDGPDSTVQYPIFWTEIFNEADSRWIAIDAMVKKLISIEPKDMKQFHPKGKVADSQRLQLGLVCAFSANLRAKDVTMRYASSMAKVKDAFLRGDGSGQYDTNSVMVPFANPYRDEQDRAEDDALAFKEPRRLPPDEMPQSLSDFRNSAKFILEKQLREKEALKPDAECQGLFELGKGAKAISERIFLRDDILLCKTIENYHKEGRKVIAGQHPRKMIRARAVTTARKREYEQMAAESGEPVMQGVYSIDQTEYIVPPPIVNGIIPKNAYGNADVFVPSMIPVGATHLPQKGIARIARKLEIDHAEAVTGFEFKARGAIPLVKGVLVADEHAERLLTAWTEFEEARIRKENKKRQDWCLKMWMKLLKGLRIKNRVLAEYGGLASQTHMTNGSMSGKSTLPPSQGGFVVE